MMAKRSQAVSALTKLSEWRAWNWIWAIFVFLLPVTSMPLIVQLVHSDVVAAPSAILLLALTLGWLLPRILLGTRLAENAKILILFVMAAILATLVSFFYNIPYYKGTNVWTPTVSALLTLFIGLCFYLISLLWNEDSTRLRFSLRVINISGAVVLLWTLMQAFFWYKDQRYPIWMREFQFFMSVGSLYRQRFVGFTLEPSWLAHQLNLLYLPWWFAASISGYSSFERRWNHITIERILFAAGMLVLFLTLSRVGLLAFLMTVVFFALRMARRGIGRLTRNVSDAGKRRLITAAAFCGVLLIAAGLALLLGWALSKLDFRMAELFNIQWRGRSDPVFYLAEKLSLAARFVYWDGGFGIFNSHPILGVGLGHAGFYMADFLNDYAYKLIEVRDLLFRSQTLLNIKSLWVRILAETGIVGFSLFLLWYLRSFIQAVCGSRMNDKLGKSIGWMGCFTLIAFLLEGFSLDTFALPYLWFSIGMVNALPAREEVDA